MTHYRMVKCSDCDKETMVKEGDALKCGHCGSENVSVQYEFEKDVGFRP